MEGSMPGFKYMINIFGASLLLVFFLACHSCGSIGEGQSFSLPASSISPTPLSYETNGPTPTLIPSSSPAPFPIPTPFHLSAPGTANPCINFLNTLGINLHVSQGWSAGWCEYCMNYAGIRYWRDTADDPVTAFYYCEAYSNYGCKGSVNAVSSPIT